MNARRVLLFFVFSSLLGGAVVLGFQVRRETSRFDVLAIPDPSVAVGTVGTPLASFAPSSAAAAGWSAWRTAQGGTWDVVLDRRSGAPLLVQGSGLTRLDASSGATAAAATVDALQSSLRSFIKQNASLLLARDEELVLDRASSGPMGEGGAWQIVFTRAVDGVPVDGDRYLFHFSHGRLVAFGATRWTPLAASSRPELSRDAALAALRRYMSLSPADAVELVEPGTLAFVARAADGAAAEPYAGPVGGGYAASLVWRFALRVRGEPGTWAGMVDARTGAVVAFEDRDLYARLAGGVYPLSNDQLCPDGCEQPSYPMPFAALTGSGAPQGPTNASGLYECGPAGGSVTTALAGPYVSVNDVCGPVAASAPCGSDLDLGSGPGTDCAAPPGGGAGNTHAARTGFYHLNRIIEKARAYLPANAWLGRQLVDNVNIDSVCNAFWNGQSVNFYKSGNGCRNTGEIAGVFLHEWGHGLDQNDGGGVDNPSEAYADTAAFLETHASCVGRGFFEGANCGGYGNACLNCTGVRDVDWAQRADGVPSTPAGFVHNNCPQGSAPCGGEVHCEAYVTDEAMWDFAARDLPFSGIDPASSWEIAERLWYLSRPGSGGHGYNCAFPFSDGCGASSWFTKMRAIDDDDGDLADGTPHAAALFAAFARHGIACGAAADASNQSTTVCPALGAPAVAISPAAQSANLSWTPVAGAASYRILRGDGTCGATATATPVASVPASAAPQFVDTGLADAFAVHYRVQAVAANGACLGPLSACVEALPQPLAGTLALDREVYLCGGLVTARVRDGNAPAAGITVHVASGTESAGETIALHPEVPGSIVFAGTLALTSDPAAAGDGRLSVADGDTLAAVYVDADDGTGGVDVERGASATVDCAAPAISDVRATDVTGQGATIRWTTTEPADSAVTYAPASPPGTTPVTSAAPARVVDHAVALTGLDECRAYHYLVASTDLAGNVAAEAGSPGGGGHLFVTGKNIRPVITSTGAPVPIPDNDLGGASSTIVVPDDHVIRAVTVRVAIEHGFDADLIVSLISPEGEAIRLVERRGGGASNFDDTVFDDDAPVSIVEGAAPFLGSYRPEEPLWTLIGKRAAGVWTLLVQDVDALDAGRIVSWSLGLTYPDASCGAHAIYADHRIASDLCASAGPGQGNGAWESGERAGLSVRIENDGSVPLTGVRATLTPLTPGVVMVTPAADYEDVPAGATAAPGGSLFVADLQPGVPCGADIDFRLDIASDQGSWSSDLTQVVGRPLVVQTAAINETFAAGIPAGWTIVNGGHGSGAASTWTAANPGGRTFTPPIVLPVAIVDSDRGGVDAEQDEQLITPARDLRTAITATLEFDQEFVWYPGRGDEKGDVDIRSSATGGAWINLRRNQGSSPFEPDHRRIDVTPYAAGAQNVQVRFHYYDASFEWWWAVDNVRLVTTAAGGCAQSACALTLLPPPVPDGIFGSAMTVERLDASGASLRVRWDASSCPAPGYHILYGDLASVAAHQPAGGVCAIGAAGVTDWTNVPAGSLWFLVVSDNAASLEGMWGHDGSGAPIAGSTPSNRCGMTLRENGALCSGDTPP